MLYRSTAIAGGRGRAVVTATGDTTELANVQRLATAGFPRDRLIERTDGERYVISEHTGPKASSWGS